MRPPPPAAVGAEGPPGAGLLRRAVVNNAAALGAVAEGGLPPPPPASPTGGVTRRNSDYSPLSWQSYFQEARDVPVVAPDGQEKGDHKDVFRVYYTPPAASQDDQATAAAAAPELLVVLVHGGGYTGLTWALVARALAAGAQQDGRRLAIAAPDLRAHGATETASEDDLSADRLADDLINVIRVLIGDAKPPPPILLVGHSLGGAIATRAAASRNLPSVAALVVIDVVEGTAMAALPLMRGIITNRPSSFPSLPKAVEWAVRGSAAHCRNVEAARVSMPSQLTQQQGTHTKYTWRTDLAKSEPFWHGWYAGMSELFLSVSAPKLLLLAGTDRLDRPLTIAQMQGKFQLVVLPQAGHAVQEDEPARTADAIASFVAHFRIGQRIPLPPPRTHA
eukprot:jgi/Chlat1/5807/Chrsp4S06279